MLDNLQKWTPLAELAGAIAVVITLGFLVVEMRSNTNSIQAQTYQALMQEMNDYRILLLDLRDERAAAREKWQASGWESLSGPEQRLYRAPSQVIWGIYESAYFANQRGALGEREWTRFEEGICRSRANQDEFWSPDLLTADFLDYVESLCS